MNERALTVIRTALTVIVGGLAAVGQVYPGTDTYVPTILAVLAALGFHAVPAVNQAVGALAQYAQASLRNPTAPAVVAAPVAAPAARAPEVRKMALNDVTETEETGGIPAPLAPELHDPVGAQGPALMGIGVPGVSASTVPAGPDATTPQDETLTPPSSPVPAPTGGVTSDAGSARDDLRSALRAALDAVERL